jgi:hypothetical protein
MNPRADAGASPYRITLQDFSQPWVLGRHLEHNVTGLRVQIMETGDAGFWVRRLTNSGKLARRATSEKHGSVPVAFRLYPMIAVSEWGYLTPRPALEIAG